MPWDSLVQDVRIGVRVLFKDLSYCLLAVAILGLGIGAVATQFSVIDAIVLRGFSFPHPEELVDVQMGDPALQLNGQLLNSQIFHQDFEDIQARQRSFSGLVAYTGGSTINVTAGQSAQRYSGAYVTPNFFRLVGVRPALGRDFEPGDDREGAPRAILLSDAIWQRDFQGDRNVLGRTVRVNGRTGNIIGVMPAGFQFPANEELWIPMYAGFGRRLRGDPTGTSVAVIGRLRPGVSLDQANAELSTLARALALENPKTNKNITAGQVQPLLDGFIGKAFKRLLFSMLAAVFLVLLIACVNVMNMQLARGTLRAKELAIRGALGATRGRLVRQMLTESLLVAAMGAVIGILLAEWGIEGVRQASNALTFPLPSWIHFELSPLTLAVTIGLTAGAGLISGLIPALLISRSNAAEMMKEGGRGNTSGLVGSITAGLVVGQIALTSMLLIGSFLEIKNVAGQGRLSYGYDEDAVMSARMALFLSDYPTNAKRSDFYRRVLSTLRSDPAVASAAMTSRLRLTFELAAGAYEIRGVNYADDHSRPQGNFEGVSDGYFETMGVRMLEGRSFRREDSGAAQPVAIVTATFALKHFGPRSPLGQQVRAFQPNDPLPWRTIVGVVPDSQMQGPFPIPGQDSSGFYTPIDEPSPPQFVTLVARPRGGRPEALVATLRADVAKVDPNLPLYFIGTPRHLHDEILGANRLTAALFTIFAGVAVFLSAVGLYGVMSFSVNQRTVEFGIRMALGAGAGDILGIIARQGALQLIVGLSAGLGMIFTGLLIMDATVLQQFIPFVSPRDPVIYGSVVAVVTAVTALSCFLPARRAIRVHPMVALRAG